MLEKRDWYHSNTRPEQADEPVRDSLGQRLLFAAFTLMNEDSFDPTSGFWDDGDWISWNFINEIREDYEIREAFPQSSVAMVRAFESLVDAAAEYHALTGRYLQIWGELGEFYAEIKYGITRNRPHAPGSDGRLGNDFVEVKTISPEKAEHEVSVKRAGNFNKLVVVRITTDWRFDARMVDRKALGKGTGKLARLKWDDANS